MKDIPPGKLYEKALELSKAVTLDDFVRITGLPLEWCSKFRQGAIPSPSVQRVECVIVKMTDQEII